MNDLLHNWEKKSAARQKDYRRLLQRADKKKVLPLLPGLHEEAFEKIDCLQCANCCKNYSPRFKTPDIKRIARHLRMKESEFIDTYLRLDEDGDYVVKTTPCPFLGQDNYCSIYEVRPFRLRTIPLYGRGCIDKKTRHHAEELHFLSHRLFCPGKAERRLARVGGRCFMPEANISCREGPNIPSCADWAP
jgi:Fe-S-cluster containining protein